MTRTTVAPVAANKAVSTKSPGPLLQRKCACGGSVGFSGKCEDCAKDGLAVQRRAPGPATGLAPPIVHEVLRSSGQPLDAATRAFMEPRFGHDFSRVRIHADAKAARSAEAIDALAYTVGSQVVFGAGRYAPTSGKGQELLAHELTHVVQQHGKASSALTSPHGSLPVGTRSDSSEREAEVQTKRVMTGRAISGISRGERVHLRRYANRESDFVPAPPKIKLEPPTIKAAASEPGKNPLPENRKIKTPCKTVSWNDYSGTPDSDDAANSASGITGTYDAGIATWQGVFSSSASWVQPDLKYWFDKTKNGVLDAQNACRDAFKTKTVTEYSPAMPSAPGVSQLTAKSSTDCEEKLAGQYTDAMSTVSDWILLHEQGHVDISCLIADKATEQAAPSCTKEKFIEINTRAGIELDSQETLYDQETDHSRVWPKQNEWNSAIANGLPKVTIR
jgi:hypothetical protein